MPRKPARDPLQRSYSARTDVRVWGMALVGLAFVFAGATVDPAANCSEGGECAPWLVPLAFVLGLVFAAAGIGQLIVNPRRGSMIDPATGDLVWWQNRTSRHAGDHGRIAPASLSRVRIDTRDEGSDAIHLYDRNGERLAYFDEEVIGHDPQGWAAAMQARWPHLTIEIDPPRRNQAQPST